MTAGRRTPNLQSFKAPKAAGRYIALQRTHLQSSAANSARRLFGPRLFNRYLVGLFTSPAKIATAYGRELAAEYGSMAPFLPESATSILDIGCGVAGIDVFLFRHYAAQAPQLLLMDKSMTDVSIRYGYRPHASFYNDLDVALAVLAANDIPKARVKLLEAKPGQIIGQARNIDLIVSLLSWGFHYPLDTYLDEALAALSPQGVIIIDLRKGTPGSTGLAAKTNLSVTVIADEPKHQRVRISQRPPN